MILSLSFNLPGGQVIYPEKIHILVDIIAFNPKLWTKTGVFVLLGTFATDFSQVFGDTDLYSGDNFKTEILWLSTQLDNNRNSVHKEIVKYNPIFKYTTFSDREDMNKAGTTNSYTTYF